MERREEQKTKPMLIRQVPPDLKRKFKVKCAENGISLQAAVIELMRQWVEEDRV
jgi:plasmid stability protein